MGLCNLLGHKHSQSELRAENLFDGVLNLMRECQTDTSVKIMTPVVVHAVETLCNNQSLATPIVQNGFAPDLLRVAFDSSGGSGIIAGGVRRAAVNSLVALSVNYGARVVLRRQGALRLSVDLLQSEEFYLRKAGGTLACNLCLHPKNKHEAVHSPLLRQMLKSTTPPKPGHPVSALDPFPINHLRGARALGCLSIHPHYFPLMIQEGALGPLLKLMHSGPPQVRLDASRAVCNLSSAVSAALELLRIGGLATVLVISRGADDNGTTGNVAGSEDDAQPTRRRAAQAVLARTKDAELKAAHARKVGADKTEAMRMRALVRDYATKAVGNLLYAWSLEEASHDEATLLLTKLKVEAKTSERHINLTAEDVSDEAPHRSQVEIERSLCKRMPERLARHAQRCANVLHAWHYYAQISANEVLLNKQHMAAGTMQKAERSSNPKRRRRKEAAVLVEAYSRGMIARFRARKIRRIKIIEQRTAEQQDADADGDGRLDFAEFCLLVRNRPACAHFSDENLRSRFDELDKDGSGQVDMSEYEEWANREALAEEEGARADADNDGRLDFMEFCEMMRSRRGEDYTEKELRERFSKIDEDGSGTITMDEYRASVSDAQSAVDKSSRSWGKRYTNGRVSS